MTRATCWLVLLTLAGCAVSPEPRKPRTSGPLAVAPVKNLAGVPLRLPTFYSGDLMKTPDALRGSLDLETAARAAILAGLRSLGREAWLSEDGASETQLHAAFTRLDLGSLREEGTLVMGLVFMLVRRGKVLDQFEVERELQLFRVPPSEAGAVGEDRFIEGRLNAFLEALTREALAELNP